MTRSATCWHPNRFRSASTWNSSMTATSKPFSFPPTSTPIHRATSPSMPCPASRYERMRRITPARDGRRHAARGVKAHRGDGRPQPRSAQRQKRTIACRSSEPADSRAGSCKGDAVSFTAPPATAAWQHHHVRSGFEVAYFDARDDGCRIDGCTTAIEDGKTWTLEYAIQLDPTWTTRSARICGRSASGFRSILLEADGAGRWLINGEPAPYLDGCLDVDLESSAMTNALPVRRHRLAVSARASAPAAYVRALGLAVERLEQTYVRTTDQASRQRYDYTARPLTSSAAWSTTSPAWYSTTRASPCASARQRQDSSSGQP